MVENIYTGESALVWIGTETHSSLGITDFTLTITRGTTDINLLGEKGPITKVGVLSIEGSFGYCRLLHSPILEALQSGTVVSISGQSVSGSTSGIRFGFASCLITRCELRMGDASTITTATIDFRIMNPLDYGTSTCWVSGAVSS